MASSSQWGDVGQQHQWHFNSNDLTEGQKISFVVEVITVDVDNGIIVGTFFPGRALVRIRGMSSWNPSWFSVSILDGCYEGQQGGIHQFGVQSPNQILGHCILDRNALTCVVETCAGMGLSSYGYDVAGLKVIAVNDVSQPLLEAFSVLHPSIATVLGDVWSTKTLCELHAAASAAGILAAGFSCQPFSSGGRQLGGLDSRASALPGVLRAAYLLRKPLVILECVASAGSNRFVRAQLDDFCSQCGYKMAECTLKLEDVWVSKRERWWAVLTVSSLGVLSLVDYPMANYPKCVSDVMPRPMPLRDDDLEQLVVSHDEHASLLKYCDPMKMILPAMAKCPTALHSWGSQVLACPCGCRPAGFSPSTLAARGIYGVFIPVDGVTVLGEESFQKVRHLHPCELALLTGCPVPVEWPPSLRLALCGLGQQASPLQSAWIGGQVHRLLDRFLGVSPPFDFFGSFRKYISLLAQQSTDLFADTSDSSPPPCEGASSQSLGVLDHVDDGSLPGWVSTLHVGGRMSFTLHFEDTMHYEVIAVAHDQVTVGNLRAAEVHINPLVELWDFIDCASGKTLSNDVKIVHKSLLVRSVKPAMVTPEFDDMEVEGISSFDEVEQDGLGSSTGLSPTIPFTLEIPKHDDAPSQSAPFDPLLALSPAQLIEVAPPPVASFAVLSALQSQLLPAPTRCKLLENQGSLWADDEIRWHLAEMVQKASKPGWVVLDPLIATASITKRLASMIVPWYNRFGFTPAGIVSCVLFDGHWIPLVWTWNSAQLVCRSWDIQRSSPVNLSSLHEAIALAVGSRTWSTHVVHRIFSAGDACGVCAVRFVDSELRGMMLPDSREEAGTLHDVGRKLFVEHLMRQSDCPRPWVWGGGLDPHAHQRLVDLFRQHGVPSDMVDSRITLLCQAVGHGSLQRSLLGTSPWRNLKSLCNQCRPPFQLVLPQELAEIVKNKAQQGGQQKKKKGVGKGNAVLPQALDPAKLKIEPGFFTLADGSSVKSIDVAMIGPFAEGVVLVSAEMVEQILQGGKPVSKFPLAAVIINADAHDLRTDLTWSQLRVPVRCLANDDPMLVHACVVQIGHGVVTQTSPPKIEISNAQASCAKIAVYRDCISCSWSDFVGGPVRYILDRIQALQPCSSGLDPCDCGKWHCGESGIKDPVLDVWRRQWLSSSFKPVSTDQAELFIVNLRFSQEVERKVFEVSGCQGIFVEPRTLDGRQPVHDWQVLWLHRATLKEVLHLKQCHPNVVGVARLGSRFGVRVHTDHAVEVGALVKPEAVILAAGARVDYELGPIPFGFDRSAVQKLCLQWKWQARAVNPIRTLDGQVGTMWHVQAASEPPTVLFSTQHGEIVVAKMKPKGQSHGDKVVPTIGSSSTVGMCVLDATPGGEDPWSNYRDPWSTNLKKIQVPVAVPCPDEAMRKVEERIEKAVLARLPQQSPCEMEIDGGDSRIEVIETTSRSQAAKMQDMESQIHQLVSHQQSIEAKIEANSRKVDVQVNQLQVQVSAQFEAQSNRMEDMFTKQMDQLSALLSKRARTE